MNPLKTICPVNRNNNCINLLEKTCNQMTQALKDWSEKKSYSLNIKLFLKYVNYQLTSKTTRINLLHISLTSLCY